MTAAKSSVRDTRVVSTGKANPPPLEVTGAHDPGTPAGFAGWLAPLQLKTVVCVPGRFVPVTRFASVTFTGAAQNERPPDPETGQREAAVSTSDTSNTLPGAVALYRRFCRKSPFPVSPSTKTRQSPAG